MSEVATPAVETAEAIADKAIETVVKTVDAVVAPVEAAVASVEPVIAPSVEAKSKAPVKKPVAAKKPVAPKVAAAVKAPVAKKSAPALAKPASAKRGPKPRIKLAATPVVEAARKVKRKAATTVAKRKYVRKIAAAVTPTVSVSKILPKTLFTQGIKIMDTTNLFAGFTTVPGADKFQTMFAEVGEKGQEAVRKGQAFAEQMSEAAKANMEAVVEASRIATAGARDLGQEVVASTKSSVEHATAAVKSLTEAKSPTEFFQLQSQLLRASFDRMVAEGSKLTEQMVKLTGEAVQPLSSRASVNAEKFSELTA
ncbi:MAG: phasin family protein [Sphingomicrobium sp.]